MMHEIIIRLYLMNKQKIVEVSVDKRLSFNENLFYLDKLLDNYDLKEKHIFDPNKRVFINKDKTINDMGINSFMTFYLY